MYAITDNPQAIGKTTTIIQNQIIMNSNGRGIKYRKFGVVSGCY